jgi:hypothetical protein
MSGHSLSLLMYIRLVQRLAYPARCLSVVLQIQLLDLYKPAKLGAFQNIPLSDPRFATQCPAVSSLGADDVR